MIRLHAGLTTLFLTLVLLGAGLTVPARGGDVGANRAELISSLLPTVVNISTRKQEQPGPSPTPMSAATPAPNPAPGPGPEDTNPTIKSFVGSGFVIDPSGLIVTNYHVIEDAFEITVMFSDGVRVPGTVVSASRTADLALLKVPAERPLAAAHWGNSDKLQVGDQVFAAGNPFGIGLSVSAGIVSGLNRDIQDSPYDDFIQTDATINHGNSGGPLFDMQGNVIGVNSTIISPTTGSAGLGFAIPASTARFVIDQLRTYGWVRPAWIGIKIQTVTAEIADAVGMGRPAGAIVAWVLPDGPAKQGGLAIGDIILRFNGTAPSDDRALLRDIARTPVGDTITLSVRHEGQVHDISVTAKEWPRNQWEARDAPMPVQQPKITVPPGLGLTMAALGPDDKVKLGLAKDLDGVLVTAVAANSDSARRGMVNGDVILRVQDQTVTTPAQVQALIDAAKGAKRDFVLMLVLPKTSTAPGPKWMPLRLESTAG
jgi:serine protease Do